MVAVLSDVNILQSAAQLGYSPYRGDTTLQMGYQSLYKKHHLTDSSYNMNMRFYCDHAKLLDSVYEKVLNNLNQQKLGLMGPVQGSDKKTK